MIQEAFKRKKIYWLAVALTLAFCYGFTLTQFSIGIDDEAFDLYFFAGGLLSQGRWGGHLVKYIFDSYHFIPFWRDFLAVCLIASGVSLWAYNLQKVSNYYFNESALIVFSSVTISFPLFAETFIFMMTTIETGLVLCFTALSMNFLFRYINSDEGFKILFLSALFLFFALSFSELAVVYFLIGTVSNYLALCFFAQNKSKDFSSLKRIFIDFSKIFLLMATVIIVNSLWTKMIQKLFSIQNSGYVSNYIMYNTDSLSGFFISVKEFIKSFLRFYYQTENVGLKSVVFIAIFMLFYSLIITIKKRKIAYVFLGCLLIISVFSLSILTGNANFPIRVLTSGSVFIGFGFSVILMQIHKIRYEKWKRRGLILFSVLICLLVLFQSKEMNRIFFTDYLRYDLDKEKMTVIAHDLMESDPDNSKEVVFIGLPGNYNLPISDVVGYSIFQWDRLWGIESQLNNSDRIFRFMNMHGYNFRKFADVTNHQQEIVDRSSQMTYYPQKGYIKKFEDYIIVQIGSPPFEQLKISESEFQKKYVTDQSTQYNIDNLVYTDRLLNVSGWVVNKGNDSESIKVALVNTTEQYLFKTEPVLRPDVTSHINDGKNYDHSGYSLSNVSTTFMKSGDYKIVFIVQSDGKEIIVNTKQSVRVE